MKHRILAIVWLLGAQGSALTDAEVAAGDQPAPTAVVVSVTEAELQTSYRLEQVFVGRVEARRSAALGFERGGQLIEVHVREGDQVVAGAVLARLDPSLLDARRAELLADLASAEADLALAEATADRYRSSVMDGAVTRQDLDEASEGARAASARLQLAEARISSIDLDLSKTELRAPFDGTVIRRTADEGTVLSAGQAVLTVQERRLPEIRIGVAGPLLKALRPGQVYRLEIDGETISAGLRAVIPLRAGASRTVDALFDVVTDGLLDRIQQLPTTPEPRASIDPALSRAPVDGHPIDSAGTPTAPPVAETASLSARASLLRPGNLAELRLSKRVEADGFWLPLSALSEGQRGLWRALVAEHESDTANADASGRAEAPARASDRRWRLVSRPIQVLHTDRERVYVRGALQAGDLVVTAGLHRLVPGQWVRIAKVGESGTDKAH